jgi:hypothetical protein
MHLALPSTKLRTSKKSKSFKKAKVKQAQPESIDRQTLKQMIKELVKKENR